MGSLSSILVPCHLLSTIGIDVPSNELGETLPRKVPKQIDQFIDKSERWLLGIPFSQGKHFIFTNYQLVS